ncbi:MAG: hypothetical protein IJ808_07300 [Muribaculaceae bacterium]|nr:hypothetical protein [Muribaculaceae bacterium]
MTRGFVTVATGDKHYYELAHNLLMSYHHQYQDVDRRLPWAIVAEEHNEWTALFDKVIILNDPNHSYLDKIELLNHCPWDENIFIDADCLVYGDINQYFNFFPMRGVKHIGKKLPLSQNKNTGWFHKDNVDAWSSWVQFHIHSHGGIIFFNDDDLTKQVYETCLQISPHYYEFRFAEFPHPADEPIMALSMAVNGCEPLEPTDLEAHTLMVFFPWAKKLKANITRHSLSYRGSNGNTYQNVMLMHWQNYNTHRAKYRRESRRLVLGTNIGGEVNC